jgi:hypothetical protein
MGRIELPVAGSAAQNQKLTRTPPLTLLLS